MQKVSTDRLMRDLKAVAADVEELIKSTAGNATEAIAEARERLEISLRAVKQNLENIRLCSVEETKNAAHSADAYLPDNVWQAIGVAAGIGLLLGAVVGLKSGRSRARRDGSN
jgi:ElaB/YqjD/DUF883 family membrane-anchored ribosome-binding protein